MRNTALTGVAAGLVLFAWGVVSHVVLPWQDAVWREFTDEAAVSRVLADHAPGRGVYSVPYSDEDDTPDRVRAFVNVLPPGTGPSGGGQMAGGVVVHLLSAFLVLALWRLTRVRTFRATVGFFAAVGLTIGVVSHGYYWNWFGFPTSYVLVTIVDTVVGWTLAGSAVAMLVRRGTGAAQPTTTR